MSVRLRLSEYDWLKMFSAEHLQIERTVLYCTPLMPKSSTMPSIFALPMFARSMWQIRYNAANIGTSRRSTFQFCQSVQLSVRCLDALLCGRLTFSSLPGSLCKKRRLQTSTKDTECAYFENLGNALVVRGLLVEHLDLALLE